MSKLAVVELGSNSLKLLVATCEQGVVMPVLERQQVTRLSRGMGERQELQPAAVEENALALRDYVRCAHGNGVQVILAVATAVLRKASNADEFMARIERETGLRLRVIDGPDEARYAYLGSVSGGSLFPGRRAVIDIGGGSTEIIFGHGRHPGEAVSLPLGAVSLTEREALHHVIEATRLEFLVDSARELVARAISPAPVERLIGVGGTVTTLAAIAQKLPEYRPGAVNGTHLSRPEIRRQIELFAALDANGRRGIPGMAPGREDIILGGALVLEAILQHLGLDELIVSERGVRHGVLLEYAMKTGLSSEPEGR